MAWPTQVPFRFAPNTARAYAIEEDLADALALVTRSIKALLLRQPDQWVRCSDTEDPRMVHWSPANSCEASVSPS
jgi:hypothetical protein